MYRNENRMEEQRRIMGSAFESVAVEAGEFAADGAEDGHRGRLLADLPGGVVGCGLHPRLR